MAAAAFSVTIVYESVEAGKRAKRLSDRLSAESVADGACALNLWNFGVLGIPEVRNAAASAAAISDVVILSLSGTAPLPAPAVEWIEMWTWLIDERKPAVVALFDSRHPEGDAIRCYLRQSALRKKLDFFPIMLYAPSGMKTDANLFNGQRSEADVAPGRRDSHALLSLSEARSGANGHGESGGGHPLL